MLITDFYAFQGTRLESQVESQVESYNKNVTNHTQVAYQDCRKN